MSNPKSAQRAVTVNWAAVRAEAKARFGISELWPGQQELMECVFAGEDVFGILPTGSGKSLCYQIPALFLQGVVVVVSPLIALMKDQFERLAEAQIGAARLDSTVPEAQQIETERAVREGDHSIVLLTPERLRDPEHLEPLKRRGVALFVVDEAHCVSQWGHDFRPAYLELRHAIEALGRPPVLALTATAPPDRIDDILANLGIPDARIVQGGIERDNLSLEVFRTVNTQEKETRLQELLNETPGSGIVYASTIRQVNQLHEMLREREIDAVRYHGRLKLSERESAQERFMSGACRVIVATNAFGLGVDKPDVRFVVHWNFPESIESYYQEAGRAGRDGAPARCALFYRLEDKRVRTFFLGGKHPRSEDLTRFMQAVSASSREGRAASLEDLTAASGLSERRVRVISSGLELMNVIVREGAGRRLKQTLGESQLVAFMREFMARYESDRERLRIIMSYGETTQCRMKFLREYFGEPPGQCCNHCDNCRQPTVSRLAPRSRAPLKADAQSRPKEAPAVFVAGQDVRHARFGVGKVIEVIDEELTISFARHGERRVLGTYLSIISKAA